MWYTYNGILFSLKKEGNPFACYNMDEFSGYYAISEISQSQKHKYCLILPFDSTYKVSEVIKFIETESTIMVTRSWGQGERIRSCCLMGIEFQICRMKKFWRFFSQECEYT